MVVKSKDGKFPMSFVLPHQGVKEYFRNGTDIEKFFEEEAALWSRLASEATNLHLFGSNVLAVAGMKAASAAFTNAAEAGRRVQSEASYLDVLHRFEAEHPIILKGSLGKLIFDRGDETTPQTAGVVWAAAAMLGSTHLRNSTSQRISSDELAALSYGQMKLTNGIARHRAERQNIERIVGELGDQVADAKANNEATAILVREATDALAVAIAEHRSGTTKLVEENASAVETLIERSTKQVATSVYETKQTLESALKSSTDELDEFKRKVRIDVGLEEPTNFWTEKADGHRTAAIIFGVVFLLAVIGMVLWIDMSAVDLVADAVERIVGNREAAALSLVPIAFITVPALAFAWVLRHLSRIIIQNLSLEADARLRGTITRTFKALAADRAMNDAELAIALQALFRPIDGKDHSEIAPPSLADILKLGGDAKP